MDRENRRVRVAPIILFLTAEWLRVPRVNLSANLGTGLWGVAFQPVYLSLDPPGYCMSNELHENRNPLSANRVLVRLKPMLDTNC